MILNLNRYLRNLIRFYAFTHVIWSTAPRSRGDPGSFSARCIAPSTLHLGLTSHAKDELVG